MSLVLGLVGAVAPAAATAEPHFTDPCGVDGITAHPTDGATTPWTDICGGRFETLGDPVSRLKVTATFAGEINDDRLGYYVAQWHAGDCHYHLSHDRGLGRYEAPGGIFVADPGADTLRIRCGEPVPEPCPPISVGATCHAYPDTRHIRLTDAVTVDGNTVSWTLSFTEDLAALADELGAGTTLTKRSLYAASKFGVAVAGPGICMGTMCTNIGSDFAFARPYTIGQ